MAVISPSSSPYLVGRGPKLISSNDEKLFKETKSPEAREIDNVVKVADVPSDISNCPIFQLQGLRSLIVEHVRLQALDRPSDCFSVVSLFGKINGSSRVLRPGTHPTAGPARYLTIEDENEMRSLSRAIKSISRKVGHRQF